MPSRFFPLSPALVLAGSLAGSLALSAGCGDGSGDGSTGMKQTVFGTDDLFDIPVEGLTTEERATFRDGDGLFDLALRPYDGLGPLYTRTSCGGCHAEGVRGPGLVQNVFRTRNMRDLMGKSDEVVTRAR